MSDPHAPHFTPAAKAAFADTGFFRHKADFEAALLAEMDGWRRRWQAQLPVHLQTDPAFQSAKISKGQAYQGLPYYVLDYPRSIAKPDMRLFRTLVRWGHGLSQHLLLSGQPLERYGVRLRHSADFLHKQGQHHTHGTGWALDLRSDPYQWDFATHKYISVSSIIPKEWDAFLREKTIIKLSNFSAVNDPNLFGNEAEAGFHQMMLLLEQNFRT